jgi:hypothetical protein
MANISHEELANMLMTGWLASLLEMEKDFLIPSLTSIWRAADHKSNTFYFISRSVSQGNTVNMNAPPVNNSFHLSGSNSPDIYS